MSIVVKQTRGQQRTIGTTVTDVRTYSAWGSSSANAIELALLEGTDAFTGGSLLTPFDGVPATINGRSIRNFDFKQRTDADDVWDATVEWSNAERRPTPEVGQLEVSFDISPQTVKVTYDKETVGTYNQEGFTPPDFQGGIGWNGKGFDGVDVMVPSFAFSIRNYFAKEDITYDYMTDLKRAAFHMNADWFWGDDPGECLFAGCSGSPKESLYGLDFKFLSIPNAENLTVGAISGIVKTGWDALSVLRREEEDTEAKFLPQVPSAVYIHRVYDPIPFVSNLRLPPTQVG